jgi:hypothetical protein
MAEYEYEGFPATRVVPDFRGLNFDAARALQRAAEVKPADPNPDAPPIAAYWWQHRHLVVATQDPEPGTQVYRYASVRVTLTPPDAPVTAAPLRPLGEPGSRVDTPARNP